MKTKLLNFKALAVMMACLACALSTAAYDMQVGGIYYTKLNANSVEVSYANVNSADYSGSITIPSLVTVGNQSWTVRGIGYKAFGECSNLTSITLPSSLTYIGNLAFIRCTSLTSIDVPENVTEIGTNAFENCTSLSVVHLPSSLTSIGGVAFTNCNNLSYVYSEAYEPPTLGSNVFTTNTYSNAYLILNNAASMEKYKAADGWSNFSKINALSYYSFEKDGIYYAQTGPYTVAVCAKDDNYNSYSGTVNVPTSVVYDYTGYTVNEVAANAFRDCSNLFHVYLPATVNKIGDFAFANCYNLNEFPTSEGSMLTEIGNNAFVNVYFSSVTLPESLTKIGNYAFYHCMDLTRIEIPDKVTTIGSAAFSNCTNLKYVVIGNGCESIGEWGFMECTSLMTVTSRAFTPPTISTYTFRNNDGFTTASLVVPYSSQTAYQQAPYWSQFTSISAMAYDFEVDGIYYRFTDGGVGVSYKGSYNTYSGSVSIPAQVTFNGTTYNVNTICNSAFRSCTGLTSVSLPNGITKIEANAFLGCTGLTQITIPTTVTYIGTSAFSNCTGLTKATTQNPAKWCEITFANAEANPLYYAHNLYFGTALMKSLTLSSTTQIKNNAFINCTSLTSITTGNAATSIGEYAFNNCTGLQSVEIGSGMTTIGASAFKGCTNLTSITSLATTPPTIKSTTFDSSHYSNATLFVANYQAKNAYAAATYWKNFLNIRSLINYDFEVNGIYYIKTSNNTVMVTYKDEEYNSYSGTISIPETVTYNGVTYTVTAIGENAFLDCHSLSYVAIPATVTTIGQMAFANSRISTLDIPESVRALPDFICQNCTELTNVALPSTLHTIGMGAFENCSNLATITIPESVTSIEFQAFSMCPSLTNVTCLAIIPPSVYQSSFSSYSSATLTVPKNSVSAYQANEFWSQFSNIVGMAYDFEREGIYYNINGNNSVEVTYRTTSHNSYSGSVSIPAQVTYGGVSYDVTAVGSSAFRRSTNLTSVTFPTSIKSIGDYAFYQCTGLTGILSLNEGLETIGNYAFAYCTMTGVLFPYSVTSIGNGPFAYCTSLTQFRRSTGQHLNPTFIVQDGVVFSTRLDNIYALAIFPGGKTTNYTVPNGTVEIGAHAFRGSIVKTVTLPTTVKKINDYAFDHCESLTGMEVKRGVTTIGSNAFSNCTAMTSVILPSTLTTLGARAFYKDNALVNIGCKATTPPVCQVSGSGTNTSTPFDAIHFTNANLRVPTGYKTAYQAANVWKLFSTITESSAMVDIILGDVNGDGTLNVSDVTALITYILGNTPPNFVVEAANVNGDNSINVADVTLLIRMVLES